jgi:xanthine dehydrogenase molybdopterin-binding subunit B
MAVTLTRKVGIKVDGITQTGKKYDFWFNYTNWMAKFDADTRLAIIKAQDYGYNAKFSIRDIDLYVYDKPEFFDDTALAQIIELVVI